MTPEQKDLVLKAFDSMESALSVSRGIGVSRDRVYRVWKQEHGDQAVKDRGNRLRGKSKAGTGNANDPKVKQEALLGFANDEPMKAVACRLGVHYVQVRTWWAEAFGSDAVKKRARRLQKNNQTSRLGSRKQTMVSVHCESCGGAFELSKLSLAKRKRIECLKCQDKDDPCPVCGVLCAGKRGLATHARHTGHDVTVLNEPAGEEPVDFVRCRICGFTAGSLSTHLRTHNLTASEYRRHYSDAPVYSSKTAKKRSEGIAHNHPGRLGLTEQSLNPYLDDDGHLIVAAAAKGLEVSQSTIREYAKSFGIQTRNRLAAQKMALDAVSEILLEKYEWEWFSSDLRNPETGALLFFDGYFPRHNLLVEYHGPQHFQFVPKWHRTSEEFARQQARDDLKARFAHEAGKRLVVLKYSDPIDREFLTKLLDDRTDVLAKRKAEDAAVASALQSLQGKPFPYPSPPDPKEAQACLAKLRKIRQTLEGPRIHPRSVTGNALCRRYFPNLYTARRKGHPTAVEAWQDPVELEKAVRTQVRAGHPTTPDRVLRALTFHHHLPAVFRPAFARFVYERYCKPGDQVWDPCSGWGGRLMGAAAAGVRYFGTDIEPETVKGNLKLAQDLEYAATVVHESALTATVPSPVKLVFTSPPYFDVEQYSDRDGQPHVSYEGPEDWEFRFLKPLVVKSNDVLNPGGRLVLVLPTNLHDVTDRFAAGVDLEKQESFGFELPNGSMSWALVFRKKPGPVPV